MYRCTPYSSILTAARENTTKGVGTEKRRVRWGNSGMQSGYNNRIPVWLVEHTFGDHMVTNADTVDDRVVDEGERAWCHT